MNGSPESGARGHGGGVLDSLYRLSWTVTRLHRSARGGLIVTALRDGHVASAELPERAAQEPLGSWLLRVEQALLENAYDPAGSAPPLLVLSVSGELAELIPSACPLRGESA